jgi:6,7-dimethyl-8-ribityllumazine synthase
MTLEVIDPYSWAENIAGHGYHDSLQRYVEWLGINQNSSGKSRTIGELLKETGWTLDEMYIAQLLKAVRDHHPDPKSIDEVLKDPDKWKADLEKCDRRLTQTNAEINANAHRTLIQLCEWLKGPGHAIVETAILKDANANSLQDVVDVARGVLHWYVCTENMVALEPGVAFLHDLFNDSGSVPTDIVLKSLDVDKGTATITETNKDALKLALPGTFGLLGLKDFLSPPPKIAYDGRRQDYLLKLGEYQAARRDKLIQLINKWQITPAPLVAAKLDPTQAPTGGLLVLAAAVNSCLDAADKLTNYVLTKKAKADGAASLEEWFDTHKGSKVKSLSLSWSLKGLALVLNGWNLYAAITTARYDYQANQSTVSKLSWAQNAAGATAAVQDVLAEIANLLKNQHLKAIFPQLMTTGGSTYHYEVTSIESAAGVTFASINVVAMLTAGVTTCISMYQNAAAASNRGDYSAASWYSVGFAGGALMTTGAACLALCLYEAGGIFTATGFGVTIGVILFTIGGIISAIASLFAWLKSSDEFQIFARKCFLGEQADKEPRFGSDPEKWSNAQAEGNNTWPVEIQKRAIHNLLGRFSVKTSFDEARLVLGRPTPAVIYTITPGVFKPWSKLEVALHYKDQGKPRTAATFVWDPALEKVVRPVSSTAKKVFDPDTTEVRFFHKDFTVTSIQVLAGEVDYDRDLGELLTTVTVSYADLPSIIRTRKLVMTGYDRFESTGVDFPVEGPHEAALDVDDHTETSALFE